MGEEHPSPGSHPERSTAQQRRAIIENRQASPASRRRRKLTARSAILSALLGSHPAQAPAKQLLAVAAGLGLQESAVRVALTRMVASGDLERSDGVYRLSARLLERQRRQDTAVGSTSRRWKGQWRLVVLAPGGEAAIERAALRTALRDVRLGELRDGVWARPDNIDLDLPPTLRGRATVFTASLEEGGADLAERLFHPSAWAHEADGLLAAFAAEQVMAERFEIAAAMVRHLLDDPLLPEALLPERWPGAALRGAYERFRLDFTVFAAEAVRRDSLLV